MIENLKIIDALKKYYNLNITPMHMPGHKRNINCAPYLKELSAHLDITEIDGFDNLHEPQGILFDAMQNASKLWESKASYFLINGSTCGILSGIRSATNMGDEIIVARNCHKSVYNAIELFGLTPHFILPTIEKNFEVYNSITPTQIKDTLNTYPNTKLIILTSPTYEGIISDIESICHIAHSKNIPVLIDEAHGAHLGFYNFPKNAIQSGADIVIQSLHKTLPSLTQTAIAHINGNIILPKQLSNQLAIFETSSPSYLLMSSIDSCVHLIQTDGKSLFKQWHKNLKQFDNKVKALNHLKVLGFGNDKVQNHTGIFAFDKSKIVISTQNTNISANELTQILREEYKIEIEMTSATYIVAMTGLGDTTSNILKLADALCQIDNNCTFCLNKSCNIVLNQLPQKTCSINKALSLPYEMVKLNNALDKTIGEYVWAYPPGIPVIIPGEKVDTNLLNIIKTFLKKDVTLKSSSGYAPILFKVLK